MVEVNFIQITEDKLRALIREEVRACLLENTPQQTPPQLSELMGLKEAAAYVGLPEASLYGKVNSRSIPYYKPGRKILIKKSDLDSWLSSKEYKSRINDEK